MRCDVRLAKQHQLDDALASYHEVVSAMKTGDTREDSADSLGKAVLVQVARDALITHIKVCPVCQAEA
jgi:hypothetical protein